MHIRRCLFPQKGWVGLPAYRQAHLGSPAQRAVKRVCVWLYNLWTCRNVVDLLWTSGRRCSKPVLLYICSEFHLLGNHCCSVGTLYNKSTTTNRGSGVWALLRPRRELYRERKCADNYNNTINLFLKTRLASAFRQFQTITVSECCLIKLMADTHFSSNEGTGLS